MGLLDGRVALITGAGRGIGRAEALLFAAEGAAVVVNDLGTGPDGSGADRAVADAVVDEILGRGGRAVASAEDVSGAEGADAAVELAIRAFGRLDVLVNNAGVAVERALLRLEPAAWQLVLGAQLTATLLCTQAAARAMIRQGDGGRIVNTTGLAGLQGAAGQAAAAAAQAGVYGLTRACAVELQKHRITVNAIAPIAHTRLTEQALHLQGLDGLTPEHVAPAALFLGSPLCRDRTGEALGVAGGRLSRLRLVEGAGCFKDGPAPWTAEEIAEQWPALGKV
jgi:NAD(P)-dependent dehydrogenase (short-subunit alcohol dehydrogenase family)